MGLNNKKGFIRILKKIGRLLQYALGIAILLIGIITAVAFFVDLIGGMFGYEPQLFIKLINLVPSRIGGGIAAIFLILFIGFVIVVTCFVIIMAVVVIIRDFLSTKKKK